MAENQFSEGEVIYVLVKNAFGLFGVLHSSH